jgi:hypothetical protein
MLLAGSGSWWGQAPPGSAGGERAAQQQHAHLFTRPTCAPPSLLADARTYAGRLVARLLQTLWATAAGGAPSRRCSCIAAGSWPLVTATTVGVVCQSKRHYRVRPHASQRLPAALLVEMAQHARAKMWPLRHRTLLLQSFWGMRGSGQVASRPPVGPAPAVAP